VNDILILPELRDFITPLTDAECGLLESSIREHGCRDPLCVWRRGDETILIDGHHRYEICERLGVPYDTVPIELDDLNAAKIWMIDNQRARRNITPAYRTELELARESIYKAEAAERKAHGQTAPGRTLTQNSGEAFGRHTRETDAKIGEAAGVSRDTVAKVRKVKEAAKKDEEAAVLMGKMRTGEISPTAAAKKIDQKKKKDTTKRAVAEARKKGLPDSSTGVLLGDFREVAPDIPDGSVDLIFTDPPYHRDHLPLYDDLGRVAARVLKPGGSLVTYLGSLHMPVVMSKLADSGLRFVWTLAVLHSGKRSMMTEYGIRVGWKPLLWYVNGRFRHDPERIIHDVIASSEEKCSHEWQQSVADAAHCIEALSEPGDLVFDPFCGGGTTAVAAKRLGRKWITCDVDASCVQVASGRLSCDGD